MERWTIERFTSEKKRIVNSKKKKLEKGNRMIGIEWQDTETQKQRAKEKGMHVREEEKR